MKPQPETTISEAEDTAVWSLAAGLSNELNLVLQRARIVPLPGLPAELAHQRLPLEVVVRAFALHIYALRSGFNITAAQFEERIAEIPQPFRERILLLAMSAGDRAKGRG